MKILFVGDVIGRPGRRIVLHKLLELVDAHQADLKIVNCENSAAGFGVTPDIAQALLEAGADVLTSGNHIWDKKQIFDYFAQEPRLLRPANYPDAPGGGLYIGTTEASGPLRRSESPGPRLPALYPVPVPYGRRAAGVDPRGRHGALRRLSRRGDERKGRLRLVSRRSGKRGGWYAHARAHGGRARAAQRARPISPTAA